MLAEGLENRAYLLRWNLRPYLQVKLNLERCNQSEYQKVLLCTNRSCWIIDKGKLRLPQRLGLTWMFIKCQIQNIQNDNVLPDQEKQPTVWRCGWFCCCNFAER